MKFLIVQFSPGTRYFFLLISKYSHECYDFKDPQSGKS
jgi:hypothetical protein